VKNYIKDGKNMTFTAPSGGVTAGVPVKIGALLVIPVASALQGELFAGETQGVFSVTKVGSQAWTEGVAVFWDNGNNRFTTTSATGLFLAGVAAEAVGDAAGATTGKVRLDGVALVAVPAPG
jgi:predicted RecA/RadA family phage recombinase